MKRTLSFREFSFLWFVGLFLPAAIIWTISVWIYKDWDSLYLTPHYLIFFAPFVYVTGLLPSFLLTLASTYYANRNLCIPLWLPFVFSLICAVVIAGIPLARFPAPEQTSQMNYLPQRFTFFVIVLCAFITFPMMVCWSFAKLRWKNSGLL